MSFDAPPEWMATVRPRSSAAAHTGSYTGSWYAGLAPHSVGMSMARRPASATRRISATAESTSWRIGMVATPQRRSGLSEHSSASHRLCARAPTITRSPSSSPDDWSPALNGAEAPPPSTSASGKITSPAMPSLSSSALRVAASCDARAPPSPVSASHSSRNLACSSDADSRMSERKARADSRSRSNASRYAGSM